MLKSVVVERERLSALFESEEIARTEVRNDVVDSLLWDRWDMVVIDLASLAKGLVDWQGLLNALKNSPELLCSLQPSEALQRLFGQEPIAPIDAMSGLIKRVLKEMKSLRGDRSRARAHRLEGNEYDPKFALSLDQLRAHFVFVEQRLQDLQSVLDAGPFPEEVRYFADVEETARDLADIMVHGSINRATFAYGIVNPEPDLANEPEPSFYRPDGPDQIVNEQEHEHEHLSELLYINSECSTPVRAGRA